MSTSNKTYRVLFSYRDSSSTSDVKKRASGTVKVSHVKDDEHARRIFKLKHAPKYDDPKITRVTLATETKSSADEVRQAKATKVVESLLAK